MSRPNPTGWADDELWVASPEPRRRSVHASRNLSRAPAASLRDRLRRPWTELVCRRVRQQSGSGEETGQGNGAASARCRPAAVMTTRAPRSGVGRDWRRRVAHAHIKAMLLGSCWRAWTRCRASRVAATEGYGKLQINSVFCKPICKPDAVKLSETGETKPTDRNVICPVRRGHRTRERPSETPETRVVRLITQRSEVQILPPLPGKTPSGTLSRGRFRAVGNHRGRRAAF